MTPEQFEVFAQIEERHWWFVARRRIMRAVLGRFVRLSADTLVVDVGCGTGGNIASLAAECKCKGLDGSTDAIRLARARFPSVDFVHVGQQEDIVGHLAGAIAVLCMDVIEHIERDVDFVTQLVNAMRPGSLLLLTVPADMSLWSEHDETNDHFRRYTLENFEATWGGLPVRVRLLSYFNSRLYPVVKFLRQAARLRGRSHGKAGTDFSMPSSIVNRSLERVFASERKGLLSVADQGRSAYRRGVSLLAVLERIEA